MHPIFLDFKRAHLSSVNDTRYIFAAFDLTAARFDLMYIVARRGSAIQSSVRRELGVCGPVVCRMTRSLEKKGLLKRERWKFDRRQILLTLTDFGREVIEHAKRFLRTNRMADRIVARMVKTGLPRFVDLEIEWKDAFDEPEPLRPHEVEAFDEMARIHESLGTVRRQCRDRAWLAYPWVDAE